jgi:hypothetical protein
MENRIGIKVNRSNNMKPISKKQNQPINEIKDGRVPGLPKDFFETVLECEVKLKEKFDMKVLQKLIDYYSTAVGYYESINDPKFMIYNQSLTLLFSQPEVKKYLSGGNIKLKLKKENLQKIINECDKKVTTEKVKNFIRRKKSVDSKQQINNLINKDMDSQTSDFKKRLAEKKKRYKLSTSDIGATENFGKSLKNLGFNNINNHNKSNQNLEFALDKDFELSEKDVPNLNLNNNGSSNNINRDSNNAKEIGSNSSKNMPQVGDALTTGTNNILDELKKEDMNNEIKGGDDNNLNDSFENKLDYNLETNNINNKNLAINKNNIKFTNKTKFLEKMKLNFDIYANDYYDNFIKKVADQIVNDYNQHFNELTQSVMDSAVNFLNQEKEMEFLSSEGDEPYKKEIGTIVQQLKDEESATKDKLISDDREKLNKLNEKYYGTINAIQSGHELEMLKERFKLDTTKSLNNLVFK